MKDVKSGCIGMFVWMAFTWFSAVYLHNYVEESALALVAAIALPTLSIIAYGLFMELGSILGFVFWLLTFPFRIFRKAKKEDPAVSSRSDEKEQGFVYLPFLIPLVLYTFAALVLNGLYANSQWFPTMALLGSIWGLALTIAVKQGVLDYEDMI